jgi:cell division protein FtsL
MTEYYTVKQIDNSRLLRPAPVARLNPFLQRVAAGSAMAGCLFFYAWQHFECIQLRYRIEQLQTEASQANVLNEQLHLEVATLRSPGRVDAIARNQLGLTVPVPGQIAPVSYGGSEPVLAQTGVVVGTPQP